MHSLRGQVSSIRNKRQRMWKTGHYARVCRQNYTNNRTVKRLTEEEQTTESLGKYSAAWVRFPALSSLSVENPVHGGDSYA